MSKIDEILYETYIEKLMNEYRKEALRKISTVVAHQAIEDISALIAISFFNSQEHAERLANMLDLDKLDFLAILEDVEGFKELWLWNREEFVLEEWEEMYG